MRRVTTGRPLVTVGVPAYNRPLGLERAVRSALAQQCREIEVLVSDDASPDPAVAEVGARLAADDPRVRFVRQARNLGHAGNYQWVLQEAKGEHFMWLSDDDWIDPDYIDRCLAAVREDDRTVLVCGLAKYYSTGRYAFAERPINLEGRRPGLRLIRYFGRVSMNGPLFGIARRRDLLEGGGFPQIAGGDWLLVAGLAAHGKIRTIPGVHIHRSSGGLGADARGLAESFGMRGLAARQHHVVVAARLWRHIAFQDARFGAMSRFRRVFTATASAALIVLRFTLVGLVRQVLGQRRGERFERRISAWLRTRDAKSPLSERPRVPGPEGGHE
jgi:hypothetical protein